MTEITETDPSEFTEQIAKQFHDAYEMFAPQFKGEGLLPELTLPWDAIRGQDRLLLIAVVTHLLRTGAILPPQEPT